MALGNKLSAPSAMDEAAFPTEMMKTSGGRFVFASALFTSLPGSTASIADLMKLMKKPGETVSEEAIVK